MNATIGLVIAVVIAVVLDFAFVSWRNRRRSPAPAATRPGLGRLNFDLSFPGAATWRIAAGFGLAIFAEAALLRRDGAWAAIGLIGTLLLLVPVLRRWVPGDQVYVEPPAPRAEPKRVQPAKTPAPASPEPRPRATNKPPTFWSHWRYYTLSNLIHQTPPDIPAEALPVQAEPVHAEAAIPETPELTAEVVELATDTATVTPSQPEPSGVAKPEAAPSVSQPAPVPPSPVTTIPTAANAAPPAAPAGRGRLMVVSPLGEVIVIDVAHNLLHRFDASGKPLQHQPLEALPAAVTANDLTFSPDGGTLYIFDAASEALRIVPLS